MSLTTAIVVLVAGSPVASQEPLPNYAATMTSPVADGGVAPWLYASRRRLPIRVGIVTKDGMMTAERAAIVRAACENWAIAARGTELGLRFAYVAYRRPGDAEIVFEYRNLSKSGTLKGYTTEFGAYATIDLAVEDAAAKPLPADDVLRVATHEVGHALGIWGHSPDESDVMSLSHVIVPSTTTTASTAVASSTTSVSATLATTALSSLVSKADLNTLRIAYRRTPLP